MNCPDTTSRNWGAVRLVLENPFIAGRVERYLDDETETIRPGIRRERWSTGEGALIEIALSMQSTTAKVSLFDAFTSLDPINTARVIEALDYAFARGYESDRNEAARLRARDDGRIPHDGMVL